MKYYIIILIVATFLIFSCISQTKTNYNQEAIELSNRAAEIMLSNPDSALILLNKATKIDKTYYVAHNNKVNIYIARDDFDQAINSAEQGVYAKPDFAEAVTMLGMLYDYTSQTDKAKEQYLRAIEIYDSRLAKSNKNKKANRVNRAQTLLLLSNNTEGQKEVYKLNKEYPNDFTIQMLVDFDKFKYLSDLFTQEK